MVKSIAQERIQIVESIRSQFKGNSDNFNHMFRQGQELKKAGGIDYNVVSRKDQWTVDIYAIVEDEGYNPRGGGVMTEAEYFAQPHVMEIIINLAHAYKNGDPVPPIIVEIIDNVPHLRGGAHRIRGYKYAIEELAATNLRRIDCEEFKGDEVKQSVQQLKGNSAVDFNPMSKAILYQRIINGGNTAEEAAKLVGCSRTHIEQTVRLLELPLYVRRLIVLGTITSTEAQAQYAIHGGNLENVLRESLERLEQELKQDDQEQVAKPQKRVPRLTSKNITRKDLHVPKKVSIKVVSAFRSVGNLISQADIQETQGSDDIVLTIKMSKTDYLTHSALLEKLAEMEQKQKEQSAASKDENDTDNDQSND